MTRSLHDTSPAFIDQVDIFDDRVELPEPATFWRTVDFKLKIIELPFVVRYRLDLFDKFVVLLNSIIIIFIFTPLILIYAIYSPEFNMSSLEFLFLMSFLSILFYPSFIILRMAYEAAIETNILQISRTHFNDRRILMNSVLWSDIDRVEIITARSTYIALILKSKQKRKYSLLYPSGLINFRRDKLVIGLRHLELDPIRLAQIIAALAVNAGSTVAWPRGRFVPPYTTA